MWKKSDLFGSRVPRYLEDQGPRKTVRDQEAIKGPGEKNHHGTAKILTIGSHKR